MRIAFMIIVLVHGLIHTLGFLNAYGISEIKGLTLTITKPIGGIWLLACLLYILFGIIYLINYRYWWIIGLVSVALSQFLIVYFWQDAKFGTIPNMLILIVSIIGLFEFNFNGRVNKELKTIQSDIPESNQVLASELTGGLPKPVRKWLLNTGIYGRPIIKSVHLHQNFFLKMKPEQENWYKATAEQFYTIDKPAFIWKIDLQMMRVLNVKGRDKFSDGKGAMLIKVLSIFPVVDEKDNAKINQGSLQRFLGEIVWFPSAAMSPYITWENIDDYSAKATLNYQGTSGSGIFHFNERGDFVRFTAMRFQGSDDKAKLREWIIEAEKTETRNGIRIPTKCKATWKLENRDWTWAYIELIDIKYNEKTSHGFD